MNTEFYLIFADDGTLLERTARGLTRDGTVADIASGEVNARYIDHITRVCDDRPPEDVTVEIASDVFDYWLDRGRAPDDINDWLESVLGIYANGQFWCRSERWRASK